MAWTLTASVQRHLGCYKRRAYLTSVGENTHSVATCGRCFKELHISGENTHHQMLIRMHVDADFSLKVAQAEISGYAADAGLSSIFSLPFRSYSGSKRCFSRPMNRSLYRKALEIHSEF